MECAGQEYVCTFKDEEDAKNFVATVLSNDLDASTLEFTEVKSDTGRAGFQDLRDAGLTEAAKALMRTKLENADTSEFTM